MKLNIYKKSNNGFTLVELLAVIVVLAIIALIGFGTVGDIISGAQESSDKETVRQYAKGVETAIVRALTRGEKVEEKLSPGWLEENVKMTGSEVKCDSVLNRETVELEGCSVQNRPTKYCYDGKEVKKCEGQVGPDDEPVQKVYTQEDIDASNGKLVAVGATNALDVVGEYSEDWTTLTITKNGQNSDGKIKDRAFANNQLNSNTVSVVIENGITNIGSAAFLIDNSNGRSLTNVTIADTVTTIGSVAFSLYGNPELQNLTNITLGSGVRTIGANAFSGSAITEITIPEGVTYLNYGIFGSCSNLTTVNLPSTITKVEVAAFSSTNALANINFNGTQEQWNAIELGEGWNDNSGNYTIHCTDGDIAKA